MTLPAALQARLKRRGLVVKGKNTFFFCFVFYVKEQNKYYWAQFSSLDLYLLGKEVFLKNKSRFLFRACSHVQIVFLTFFVAIQQIKKLNIFFFNVIIFNDSFFFFFLRNLQLKILLLKLYFCKRKSFFKKSSFIYLKSCNVLKNKCTYGIIIIKQNLIFYKFKYDFYQNTDSKEEYFLMEINIGTQSYLPNQKKF